MTAPALARPTEQRLRPQPGPQLALLSCPIEDVFYGGARGGGKTWGLILDWLSHAQRYGAHARGILFRRTLTELFEVGLVTGELLPAMGWKGTAVHEGVARLWTGPNGAVLRLAYLDQDEDAASYQGHSYTWLAIDEVGNFPSPTPIDRLWATLRSVHGVPCVRRLTGNPGGVGHNWLKSRYIDPAPPYLPHVMEIKTAFGKTAHIHMVFIPAKLEDNPLLMLNDPKYEDRLMASGPDYLVKAWRYGLWDIVAGGYFDDLWNRERHVVAPFAVPTSWRIDRSFDWGSTRPFSVGWWAEADGTDFDGQPFRFPRGSIIRIAEWYGWVDGKPNEGLRMPPDDIAKGIIEREATWPLVRGPQPGAAALPLKGHVKRGPADPSIFTKEPGQLSIAESMARYRVEWVKGVNTPGSRKNGWQQVRELLKHAAERPPQLPGLWVFSWCTDGFLRTVPVAARDKRKLDDIDTNSEDHALDDLRYRVMSVAGRWEFSKVRM